MARHTSSAYLDYSAYTTRGRSRRRRLRARRRVFPVAILTAFFVLCLVLLWRYGPVETGEVEAPPYPQSEIAQIAAGELGQDWEKTCEWWGIEGRDEWCAMFVCWAADQSGYGADTDYLKSFGVNSDIGYPNDSGASSSAHARFHDKQGRYRARQSDYLPSSGDFIYFNWAGDGVGGPLNMDHIGLVERVADGKVYTLEGNSQLGDDSPDLVRRKCYDLSDTRIRGYSDMSDITKLVETAE